MSLVNKVDISFEKVGFIVSKWSNLNAPESYTPWCHLLLGSTVGCPFLWMKERENDACRNGRLADRGERKIFCPKCKV